MTIEPISHGSVALYITPADLKEKGFTPCGLTLEGALNFTRAACQQAGIVMEGTIEIEAFPDKCGVLVFARVKSSALAWLRFESWDDLCAALAALGDTSIPDGELFLWQEGYYLSLPGGTGGVQGRLEEYGIPIIPDLYFAPRMAEVAILVARGDQLTRLMAGRIGRRSLDNGG